MKSFTIASTGTASNWVIEINNSIYDIVYFTTFSFFSVETTECEQTIYLRNVVPNSSNECVGCIIRETVLTLHFGR